MPDNFTFRFFWGPRSETEAECATRLGQLLRGLKKIDPIFDQWSTKVPLESKPPPIIKLRTPDLQEVVQRAMAYGDFVPGYGPPQPMGFYMIHLWTNTSWMLNLRITTGDAMGSLMFDLPAGGVVGRRLYKFERMMEITSLIVRAWAPNVGELWSSPMQPYQRSATQGSEEIEARPLIGWLSYFAREWGELPELDGFDTTLISGRGTIIATTKQVYSSENKAHIERWLKLRKAFKLPTKPRKNY